MTGDVPREGFFQALVEQAPELLAAVSLDGVLTYANPRFEPALGYRHGELAGRTLFELIHEEDRCRVIALFASELRIPGANSSFRARFLRRDDSWVVLRAVARSGSGGEQIVVVSLAAVSGEDGVRAPMTRRAMDEVSGYVSVSADGHVLTCNPAFLRFFGLESEQQARSTGFWSLFRQSDLREQLPAMLAELGQIENFEAEGVRRDRSVVHVLMNLVARSADDPDSMILDAQILDVTEKRKLEEQWRRAQRMEAMGKLACAVAHDFNNLLTAILGYTELLERALGPDSPHQVQLEQVLGAGRKAASLTRQLLTFGKGKVAAVEVVELNDVVRGMQPLLAQLLGTDVEMVLDLHPEIDLVAVDKSQLEQVILNLVVNARDAMEGRGRLTITTSNQRVARPFVLHHDSVLPGDYTMLAVRDTGCGIGEDIMEHLFEPFFTTKDPGKGTGLGLATVYGIVKKTGGFISVYNEPSGGVTFKVSFPSSPGIEGAQPKAEPGPVAVGREERTVMLVEDDSRVRRLLEETLRASGYRVLVAGDGLAALELARSQDGNIDLLLTDVSMPQLDGIGLATRFSAERPSVPILLISGTADADPSAVETSARVEFLEKPFTPSKLLEIMETML